MTLIQEVPQYYPVSPAAGSPYGTGSGAFGQGAQYKRFASLFGGLAFNVSGYPWNKIELELYISGSPS